MKAVLCTQYGGPADLVFTDIADPTPASGQAVVRVHAVGLNFFDNLLIAGKYQVKPEFPFSPGAEIAGVVESVGDSVTEVAPGDRVMASCGFGGARERIALSARQLVKIPDALEFDRAASLIVTYGTTLHALQDRGELKSGETLVVLGAAGGVGLAACEIGALMGARVVACASSDEKLEFARQHGATETLNYTKEPLRDGLKRLCGEKGADVVYDPVGGAFAEPALRSLGWEGRLLVIGFAAGEIPKLPLNLVLLKSVDVRGVFWGAWTLRSPEAHRIELAKIVEWAADGRISAHVHASYPLAETARALEDIAARRVMGKAVLRP